MGKDTRDQDELQGYHILPGYLTHIQLNITEQGVEWRGDEGKDGGSRKLLPE